MFTDCYDCVKSFKQKCNLNRHQRIVHGSPYASECPVYHLKFNRKDNFKRHIKTYGENSEADKIWSVVITNSIQNQNSKGKTEQGQRKHGPLQK